MRCFEMQRGQEILAPVEESQFLAESRALLIFLIALKCVFCSVNPQQLDLRKVTPSRTLPRTLFQRMIKDIIMAAG
jgi:hypothetical protein